MCYEMCASPRDEPGHDVERANPCPPAVYFSAYGVEPEDDGEGQNIAQYEWGTQLLTIRLPVPM